MFVGSTGAATGDPASTTSVLCIPHLAGNATVFSGWGFEASARLAVVPAELPGRGRRLRERPLTSIQAIVEDLAQRYAEVWTGSFALYGHSMGAIVAYELARLLTELGSRPIALIVGASPAPALSAPDHSIHEQADRQVVEYLRTRNGTPAAVIESPELAAIVLRVARADLEALETYVYRPGPPLTIPITAVAATHDAHVHPLDLEMWRACTSDQFQLELIAGGHFFAQASREVVLEVIERALNRARARRAAAPANADVRQA